MGCGELASRETAAPGARGGGAASGSGPLLLWGAGAVQDPQQIPQRLAAEAVTTFLGGPGTSFLPSLPLITMVELSCSRACAPSLAPSGT